METETTSSNNKSSYGLVNAVNRALGGLAKDYNLEVMTARGQQYFIWIIGEGRPQIKKLWNHALSAQDFIDLIGEDDHYDESSFEDHYREHLLKLVTAIEAIKAEHPKLDLKELKRMCVDEGTLNIDMKSRKRSHSRKRESDRDHSRHRSSSGKRSKRSRERAREERKRSSRSPKKDSKSRKERLTSSKKMETTSSNNKSSSELVNQALIFRKEEKYDKSTKILLDAVYCALGDLAKDYNLEVMTARGQQYFIWIIGEDHIMQLWQEAKSAQSFIDFFGEDNGVADNWIGDLLELVTAIEAIKAEHPKLDIKKLKRKCVDESGKVGPDIKFI